MLKQISNLGKNLSRKEQKNVLGGTMPISDGGGCKSCSSNSDCTSGVCATWSGDCSGPCGCGQYCL